MHRVVAAGRAVVAVVAGLAVLVAATGWLYLLQPRVEAPGPRVGDALPLDELSRRSALPLAVFALVWLVAGLLLGLLGRVARLERLASGLVLAVGTGVWCYLVTAVSILIVRQVPADAAFDSASKLRAVYLPAALAGLGGALTGRRAGSARRWAPAFLAAAVAATGLLAVLEGILPHHGRSLVDVLAPAGVHPVLRSLVAPAGLALVLAARGLMKRKRRAWIVAVAVLAGSSLLQLLHGFTFGAAAAALLVVALVAQRHEFTAPGDRTPEGRGRLFFRALGVLAAISVYGFAALWVNRLMADQQFTLGFAARETGRALLGLNLAGSAHLVGEVGAWFPKSVFLLGCVGGAWLLTSWLGPWRYRLRQEAREREVARALVAAWGVDTLAPFVLRADKSYFFEEHESAFLAYKVVGGVAVVSGDPVGSPPACDRLLRRFLDFARERDWRVAVLGASESWVPRYRELGLHALYHGDEAVLEVERFSLDGRAIRKVRQSVHRLERAGYTARALHPCELDEGLRGELEAVAREWRGNEPERGFVMALDTLFRLEEEDALFVVGFGPEGRAAGFLHFAVSKPGCALSLSSMPRLRSTPNGFNEWLVCEAVAWARGHGFARISLNFAPFAALLAPEVELSALQRVERRALLSLKGHFQLDNLLLFNRKFAPSWQRRFVVYERRRDLPRVGIAALAAEAYLPFAGRRSE